MSVLFKQDDIYYRINEISNNLEYSTDQINWHFKCNEESIMKTLDNLTKDCKK